MPAELVEEFDAVVLAGGAEQPRDLPVPGRELDGVHFAMDFLPQQNKVVAGDRVAGQILATGKHVVVIGGGDTGSDCVGTSNRHGARSVTQFELLPQPPEQENKPLVWPYWPVKLRSSSSHEEGCERDWAVATKRFEGRDGKVEKLIAARVAWQKDEKGQFVMREIPDTEFEMKADLVLLAMGFVGPVHAGLISELDVAKDARGNVAGRHRDVSHVSAEGVRGRRHAARPVARRLGDPRRPPVRARGGRVPDGLLGAAPLTAALASGSLVLLKPSHVLMEILTDAQDVSFAGARRSTTPAHPRSALGLVHLNENTNRCRNVTFAGTPLLRSPRLPVRVVLTKDGARKRHADPRGAARADAVHAGLDHAAGGSLSA